MQLIEERRPSAGELFLTVYAEFDRLQPILESNP
jgi:hypothetical protein